MRHTRSTKCDTRSEAQANLWLSQQALKATPVAAWAVPSRRELRSSDKRVSMLSRVLSVLF